MIVILVVLSGLAWAWLDWKRSRRRRRRALGRKALARTGVWDRDLDGD